VPELWVDSDLYQAWQEAVEREIELPTMGLQPMTERMEISVPSSHAIEPIRDRCRRVLGVIQRHQAALQGSIELTLSRVANGVFKVTVRIENQTPLLETDLALRQDRP